MIRKGTYVLFLRFCDDVETEVGSLGRIFLKAGDYCYTGSAMGGLDQRLSRHLRHQKTKRWHIDYLTVLCDEMCAYEHEGGSLSECRLADLILSSGGTPAVKGFGCSDCDCQTHLFRVDVKTVEKALEAEKMTVFFDRRAVSEGQ